LKQLQEEMIDGGKRAGDKNLKERRKQKKKAAETRIKALGEALGHVDDEDGVLIKVYDDIQEELKFKNDALKQTKQKVKALNAEIHDLQQEFEDDRTDYLDTIRKQDQQLKLLQQILDKIQPTIRKDSNYW
jgi:cell division protein FtsB